ncbi:hypothetical protein [Faecalibacter macacae]|uniref:Uncharacterized protein n=1 Tax=Faecalibacter macacae TaxID=1859289 RepID=A0A3L9MFY1_9FLAO|nr:hypothetical protein [Faecalibacter macacae]RLZ11712.1 hypothetical protein EAH69_04630 [Faecalibacter macacae]
MEHLYVEVTFDFNEEYKKEKEIFLDYLMSEHWVNINSERNWKIGFNQDLIINDKIAIIKEDLEVASKISKIKAVDYAIVLNDSLYFGSIN